MTTANEIADKLAGEHNLTKAQGKALVEGVFKAITEAAAAGEEISLPGFGKFKVVEDNAQDRLRQAQNQAMRRQMRGVARQVSMNPDDGMDL